MNKLIIPNGGMPLFGDDFAFLDDANRDAFKGVIFEIAAQYSGMLILGGCAFSETSTHFNITEGYVMINYEICYIPGSSVLKDGNPVAEIVPDNSYDPDGLKSFANTTSHDTWQLRAAKLVAGTSDVYLTMPGSPKLSDGIAALVLGKAVSVTISDGAMDNDWQTFAGSLVKYHKHLNVVRIQGGISEGVAGQTFFQLPVGYRPAKDMVFICAYDGGAPWVALVNVLTTGDVQVNIPGLSGTSIDAGNAVWLAISFTTV